MKHVYTENELAAADRLERYLSGLEHGELAPNDATAADVALYSVARTFAVATAEPRRLELPLRKRKSLRQIMLWLTPLPLVAATILIYVNVVQSPSNLTDTDITDELALVEQSDRDLLLLEQDLDASLKEIDLLTSTNYIDQL